jgi:hypothetical protein
MRATPNGEDEMKRKLLALLLTLGFAAGGLGVAAAPAAAEPAPIYFEVGDVTGSIVFVTNHDYRISGTIYNPYPQGVSIGYQSHGVYYDGNGYEHSCGPWTPYHANSTYDTVRSWTDSTRCSYASYDGVYVVLYYYGQYAYQIYVDNPFR